MGISLPFSQIDVEVLGYSTRYGSIMGISNSLKNSKIFYIIPEIYSILYAY